MTSSQFQDRLTARAEHAGVTLTATAREQLEAYFRLLARWNAKINLTALPLQRPTAQTFDRLLIEPLVAARYVADSAITCFDLGSGGGSPAIPLKIVRPSLELTMIEAKARKAAFLREVVRSLGLAGTEVENERFENISFELAAAGTRPRKADLVTVRAVKSNAALFTVVHRLLSLAGHAMFFHSEGVPLAIPEGFSKVESVRLPTMKAALLTILRPRRPV